jgi:hypothetical protein
MYNINVTDITLVRKWLQTILVAQIEALVVCGRCIHVLRFKFYNSRWNVRYSFIYITWFMTLKKQKMLYEIKCIWITWYVQITWFIAQNGGMRLFHQLCLLLHGGISVTQWYKSRDLCPLQEWITWYARCPLQT